MVHGFNFWPDRVLGILLAVSFVLWGNAPTVFVSITANVLIGIFQTGNSVMTNTIFQSTVDRKVFGRVMAFRQIVTVLGAAVGIILAPVCAEWFGVGASMLFAGILAGGLSAILAVRSGHEIHGLRHEKISE